MRFFPTQCDHCSFTWEYELQQASIEVGVGGTISFAPGAIQARCPRCGAVGVNAKTSSGTVTAKGIRGLLAVLRTVSASTNDFERLAEIARAAHESGVGPAQVAEQINASIPRLKAVGKWVLSQESGTVAAWIAALVAVLMFILSLTDKSPAPTPAPTVVIQCGPGDEQEIKGLFEQLSREIRSDVKPSSEPLPSPAKAHGDSP